MMSATILTSKRHHYTSYYYNFHHFRWKAHHKISISSSEANVEMETRKNSENRNHAYYKSTMSAFKERKHKRTHQHQSYLPFQPVMTFGSFILMLSIFLLLTSNRAVYCEEKLSVTEALDFEDFPQQPSRSVEIKNCFSLERKKSWPQAIVYENSTASVNIDLSRIDSSVLECIKGQMGQESTNNIEGTLYQISIVLKHKKERTLVDASDSTLVLSSSQIWYKSKAQRKSLSQSRDDYKEVDDNFSLQRSTITFPYILFSGIYRIQFHVCDDKLILEENLIKNSDTRNKQIGDLEEEYNSIASYDSDQNTSSTTSNKTSEDKRNLLFTNLKTSDNIKTQKQRSCRIHNPTETVVESKNIIVEKDFKLKNWCTISTKRQKDLKYFVLNDSQDSSIMSIGNQTQNTNDSSSSDIILNVENSLPDQTFNSQDHSAISISRPEASSKNALSFKFSFSPCHELFPYETATVMVYSVKSNDLQNTDISLPENENQTENNENETFSTKISLNESALKNKCGKTINGTNLHPVHVQKSVKISRAEDGRSVISFVTPELERSAHYCAITTSNHRLCTNSAIAEKATGEQHSRELSNESKIPQFCQPMSSEWKYVISYKDDLPFIATYVPFCTTHFRCGWLYILVVGSVAFLTSCLLAVCFVHCCCRTKRQHIAIPLKQEDAQTFDTICLNDPENINSNHDGVDGSTMPVLPQKTWTEMHDEFYAEPPKNPGKILLLYSPDTKQFKELQKAFRNFLEMACHCVVLDLFDEALFQTICYDPEKWLANLLKDRHFKIIVVCSEGAFKRQHALINGEVLNIPKYDNSSLDGLFSAGLKFIQQNHAYDHRRLTLVRYESLALTKPEHKLTMMTSLDAPGSNRISKTEVDEYIITSQLPELFCWIHDIPDGRDYRLVGRPWDKYHLELQLLRDELKSARNERRSTIIK